MGEAIKNRLILVLSIATLIFFLGTLGSCNNIRRSRTAYNREMLTRLDLEEKLSKFTQEKDKAEAKADKLKQDLEAEKAAHQATKNALLQEQLVNKNLKEESDKVTKMKEKLEEDLQETPVTTNKADKSK